MRPARWSLSIKPRATMSRSAPLGWTHRQARQSSAESLCRLARGFLAIRSRIEARSASVTSRPRYFTFTTTAGEGSRGETGTQALFSRFLSSALRAHPPPRRRRPRRLGVAPREEDVELVRRQGRGRLPLPSHRPEAEPSSGEPLLAEPKTLPVVGEHSERLRASAPEDEDRAGEGIGSQHS